MSSSRRTTERLDFFCKLRTQVKGRKKIIINKHPCSILALTQSHSHLYKLYIEKKSEDDEKKKYKCTSTELKNCVGLLTQKKNVFA